MSKLMVTIGLMAMVAFSLVLFIAFAAAYFSPDKAVVIRVNNYGEADIEMILLTLLLPVSMLSTFFVIRKTEKGRIEEKGYTSDGDYILSGIYSKQNRQE